ncbi:heterokaryon incompatibility protein-domain-containing protein [Microdochium trichocladiopsis]|uniref:Heterokaryon incompatibility protein-domain-containing protein n=1 Tax=Microdochium trichocladiopsis TaxID=1682393 RepID=A0A9P9BLR6_9PEZI|nr:heterokaryon incompatibility protein-domain-containing protein [Microdochium trichocladiopsis]KAH7025164.1 heterokaryon incompatibility protein-domain-containing protein [Microdochium trichocladiopsis]
MSSPKGRASLATLPAEIFVSILQLIDDQKTFKALRHVKTNHGDLIASHVFRNISISILRSSHHRFTSIASRHHLARHVKTITWYDLPDINYVHLFQPQTLERPRAGEHHVIAEGYREHERTRAEIVRACWMTVPRGGDTRKEHRAYMSAVFEYFCEWFVPAVAAMPLLENFASARADPGTELCVDPRDGSKLTVGDIRQELVDHHMRVEWRPRAMDVSGKLYRMFSEFITSTIGRAVCARHASSACPRPRAYAKIESRVHGRIRTWPEDFSVLFEPIRRDCLQGIHTLQLSLDRIDETTMAQLMLALSATTTLGSLAIGAARHPGPPTAPNRGVAVNVGAVFLDHCQRHEGLPPAVKALQLITLDFSLEQLASFVEAHSGRLDWLRLTQCSVDAGQVATMIQQAAPGFDALDIFVSDLTWFTSGMQRFQAPNTTTFRGCHSSSSRRAQTVLRDSAAERVPPRVVEGGPHGIRTLEQVQEPDERRPEGTDIQLHSQVISLYARPYRFSIEAHKHRWMWGRVDARGPVYYWSATEEHLGEPTSTWKFTHGASGETRYGDDPRVFWDDWDEDMSGNIAEPTPFGAVFEKVVKNEWAGWNWLFSEGKTIPAEAIVSREEVQAELVRQGVWRRAPNSGVILSRSSTYGEYFKEYFGQPASSDSCALCGVILEALAIELSSADYAGLTAQDLNAAVIRVSDYLWHWQIGRADRDPASIAFYPVRVDLEFGSHYHQLITHLTVAFYEVDAYVSAVPEIWTTPAATTGVQQKHALARRWLEGCERDHARCNQQFKEPARESLPKRLIRLSGPRESAGHHHDRTRLVESASEPAGSGVTRYAALSHCWGGRVPMTTVRANLDQHMQQISESESEAPRTFREAFALCRSLGISYIWIDSLCIVQDDAEDWRAEAARMKDVYSNALLTIAASSAASCNQGLFIDGERPPAASGESGSGSGSRDEMDRVDRVYRFTARTAGTKALGVRAYPHALGHTTARSILSTRGWALQEQVLSRRIVHCSFPEMHWQCGQAYLTEAGVDVSGPPFVESFFTRTFAQVHLTDHLDGPVKGDANLAYNAWRGWTWQYCRLQFAFPSDKLAALAGIVQRMAEASGYTHLLGCWKETIAADLAWVGESAQDDDSQVIPGIPSWSWISRCDRIITPISSSRSCGTVTNCARLHSWDIEWQAQPLVSELRRAHLMLCGPVKGLFLTSRQGLAPLTSRHGDEMYTQEEVLEGGLYTCLLLQTFHPRGPEEPGGPSKTWERFLILEAVDSEGRDVSSSVPCYRRVGLGESQGRHHFDDAEDTIIKLV